ncbi:hypothetical protein [Wolbachia endosymbiont of Wuchereria bancrofti]|nr:hypothetical protein [Wolbachia endosymbiont of Wuchereria bancrofti]
MEKLKNLLNQKSRELISVKQQLDNTVKELNDGDGKIKKLENKII